MRLIVLAVSTFGSIGTSGQRFISELSRRTHGRVPSSLLGHASWAVPRLGPMIRMALTHAVRRGVAVSIHRHWRRGRLSEWAGAAAGVGGGGAGVGGGGAGVGGGGAGGVGDGAGVGAGEAPMEAPGGAGGVGAAGADV